MKGRKEVLDGLAEVLTAELTAINQYFHHHALCEDWGYDVLAKAIKLESMDEMRHAEMLSERILFLDGMPSFTKYSKISIGKDVPELMRFDLDLELEAVDRLNRLIGIFQKEGDHSSAQLLGKILLDEEHHVDWLEKQLSLIENLGVKNYLTKQVSGPAYGEQA